MNILNDTEHRIFLSAMAREKEVCKKIDGEIYDSTVKMLVPVCESIERKVDRAILIPEGATNGDMIKALFPNARIEHGLYGITGIPLICLSLNTRCDVHEMSFVEDWWNAPYKGVEK